MQGILFKVFRWLLGASQVKFVGFTFIFAMMNYFIVYITQYISAYTSTSGLTSAFSAISPSVWYFITKQSQNLSAQQTQNTPPASPVASLVWTVSGFYKVNGLTVLLLKNENGNYRSIYAPDAINIAGSAISGTVDGQIVDNWTNAQNIKIEKENHARTIDIVNTVH
jgi:hypothetical protein